MRTFLKTLIKIKLELVIGSNLRVRHILFLAEENTQI